MTRILTTANGVPVADNQNSLTAGERGPIVLEDFHLLEKLAHFGFIVGINHAIGGEIYATMSDAP